MLPVQTPLNSTARGTRALKMMVMVPRVSSVQGNPLKIATISHERSKWRYARLTCTGTVRSSRNIFPFPVEEQNCHFEPKKICELEMKTRPKKAKKYSYTKDCKEQ